MRSYWLKLTQQLKKKLSYQKHYLIDKVQQIWFKATLLLMVVILLMNKDLSFQIDLNTSPAIAMAGTPTALDHQSVSHSALSFDFLNDLMPVKVVEKTTLISNPTSEAELQNLSNTYSNMDFDNEQNNSSRSEGSSISKRKKQENYIARFAAVAQSEMAKYGIPASIKLAQGLIESNAGESRLSRKNNNHFGMKCFSKKCSKGHCTNFTDDSHKDFFRNYDTAWESYRAHSIMLNGKRYRHLQGYGKDYKAWAKGLKKAGYATDKKYAEKLIHLIERLGLEQFDEL